MNNNGVGESGRRRVPVAGPFAGRARCQRASFRADAVEKPLRWISTDVRRTGPPRTQRDRGQSVSFEGPSRRQLHRRSSATPSDAGAS